MDSKQIKEESRLALIRYWQEKIGKDSDDPYHSMPQWVEIRKILQAVMEYDHDPGTCQHDFETVMYGEEKGQVVCHKCGIRNHDAEGYMEICDEK